MTHTHIYPILSLFMDDFPIISPIFRQYDSRPTFLSRSAKPKQSRCPRTPRLRAVPNMAKYSAGWWIKSMDYAWKGLPWIPLQWNKPASSALIALIVIYSKIYSNNNIIYNYIVYILTANNENIYCNAIADIPHFRSLNTMPWCHLWGKGLDINALNQY